MYNIDMRWIDIRVDEYQAEVLAFAPNIVAVGYRGRENSIFMRFFRPTGEVIAEYMEGNHLWFSEKATKEELTTAVDFLNLPNTNNCSGGKENE
jgi:hypothetical protein